MFPFRSLLNTFNFYIIDPLNIQRPFGIVRHLIESRVKKRRKIKCKSEMNKNERMRNKKKNKITKQKGTLKHEIVSSSAFFLHFEHLFNG